MKKFFLSWRIKRYLSRVKKYLSTLATVLFWVGYFFAGVLSLITSPLVFLIFEPLGLKLYYVLTTKSYRRRRYKKWLKAHNIQTFKGREQDCMFGPVRTNLVRRRPMPEWLTYNRDVHRKYLNDINPLKWVILVLYSPGKFFDSFP